jgi:CRISPR/Cas system-associated exonuclease Cas4 (RecB family)
VARWVASCRAIDAIGASTAPSPRALDVVAWPELYAFRQCPLQYRYRFQTRVGDVLGTDDELAVPLAQSDRMVAEGVTLPRGVTPSEFGVIVHEALRRVYGRGEPVGEAIDAAAIALVEGPARRRVVDAARRLVDGVVASEIGEAGAGVAAEEAFEVRIDTLVVHGVFDRIERGPDGLRVIDYKVGVEHPAHAFQVQLYAWALGRIDDEAVDGLVCYLREGGAHVQRVTTDDSAAVVESVAADLERAIRAGDFPAGPGEPCALCAYRSVCPSAVL